MKCPLLQIASLGWLLTLLGGQVANAEPALPVGITLIEQHRQNGVGINYQKYRLKNGLTLLLHQDKSDPLVHVDLTYHVGSAREQLGKSGFAHFFEHMMFQGSKHVADQQHLKLITEAGGVVNGSTNRDITNYYQTVPANQLEKVLWLEADRMGFLLDAVSAQKFEIQRATVKNERAQNYDNRPYGLVAETLAQSLFPNGHPYSWPTIGHMQEINSANLADLKAFFLRWYGPNNATLTIGGDIDVAQTLAWVDKYFAEIPAASEVIKAKPAPVTLDANRFVTLSDNIVQPLLVISWPTQYPQAPATMPLDMLAALLGQGKNSLLYQALVKTQQALSVRADQSCDELACVLQVTVLAPQGQNLAKLYQQVSEVLAKLAQQGIDEQRLAQLKNGAEADAIYSLESVHGKVAQLASNETFYGQPDRLQHWLTTLNAITAPQVNNAFKAYIYQKPSVVLSVVPKNSSELAVQPANFKPSRPLPPSQAETVVSAEHRPRAAANSATSFDRSQIPAAQNAINLVLPKLYRTKLANGIEVVGTFMDETPTVSIHLLFPAGRMMTEAGQLGLASLTAQMVQEGSDRLSSEQLAAELELLGSSVRLYSATDNSILTITSLSKNLDKTLALAEQVFFSPRFAQQDFDRIKKQTLERIKMSMQSPKWLAAQAQRELLFSDPWSRTAAGGSLATVSKLSLADVKQFYQRNYTPNKAKIIAVGDITSDQLVTKLATFASWQGQPAKAPAKVRLTSHSESRIWLVDKDNAPQTSVQFVRVGIPYDATAEQYRLKLASFPLAGNFNSRLNLNLREEKGYTYGANGGSFGAKTYGIINFGANVRANATVATINEIEQELADISSLGFTEQELDFMRTAVGQKNALSYETPDKKANLISHLLRYQLNEDYSLLQQQILQSIEKKELDALAKKWFNPKDYQIIVVGDAKSLSPELQKIGLPVTELAL